MHVVDSSLWWDDYAYLLWPSSSYCDILLKILQTNECVDIYCHGKEHRPCKVETVTKGWYYPMVVKASSP